MANHASHAALPYPVKGARYTLLLPYLDADGDPTDPTTPDTELSKDDGSAADAAEEVASPKNSVAMLTLTGAETDCSCLSLAGKAASGPKTTLATLYPRVLAEVGTGTLSAGSAGGGTLGTLLAYDVTGCFIKTTGGTGGGGTGGANNQARKIVTYNTSSGAFTVSPNWETTPSTDTTYAVLLPEGVTLGMLRTLNPTTAGRTLDVSSGGEAGVDWANVGSPTTTLNLSGTTVGTLTTYTGNTPQTGDAYAVVNSGTHGNAALKTLIDAVDNFVDTEIADIQARLPAALVGGRMDANVGAISSDATAADNLEAAYDGTGYAHTGNTYPWTAAWDAEVQSEVQDAIVANNLDHLVLSAVDTDFATTVHANSVVGHLADNGAGFDRTTDSLEAIRDRGDAAWGGGGGGGATAADVWDYLTSAATTSGSLGKLVVDNLNATVSSRLAPTVAGRTLDVTATGAAGIDWANVENPTTTNGLTGTTISTSQQVASVAGSVGSVTGNVGGLVAGSVGSISGVTFPANFSALSINASGHVARVVLVDTTTTNTDMRGTNGAMLAYTQPTGFLAATFPSDPADQSLLVAATDAILTAVGDVPTNSELTTALAAADDAVLAAVAALNNLSAAQVNAEVVDALATDTYAEPTGTPGATITLAAKLNWLYMALRNRVDVTATKKTFYDDGGTAEWEKDLSDDGTVYSESEANAP